MYTQICCLKSFLPPQKWCSILNIIFFVDKIQNQWSILVKDLQEIAQKPQILKNLRYFQPFSDIVYFYCEFLTPYFKDSKNEFRQQVLGLGIFPHNCLKALKVFRKS